MPLHLNPRHGPTGPGRIILELVQIRDLVHLDVALLTDFTFTQAVAWLTICLAIVDTSDIGCGELAGWVAARSVSAF